MSKKILSIFMSITMIIACLPMMTFAGSTSAQVTLKDGKYSDDYTKYQVTVCYDDHSKPNETITVDTIISFDGTEGYCVANAEAGVKEALAGATVTGDIDIDDAKYYNLNGATIVKDKDGTKVNKYDADAYMSLNDKGVLTTNPFGEYIKLVRPSNVTNVIGSKDYVIRKLSEIHSFKLSVKYVKYVPYTNTILYLPIVAEKVTGLTGAKDVIGTIADQAITIESGAGLDNVTMSFDGEDVRKFENKSYTATYTNKPHTFEIPTYGVDVQYANLYDAEGKKITDSTKLKWTTTVPEMIEPGTYGFRVKVSKSYKYATYDTTADITVKINKAEITYAFNQATYNFALGNVPATHEFIKLTGVVAGNDMINSYIDKYVVIEGMPTMLGSNTVSLKCIITEDEIKTNPVLKTIYSRYTISEANPKTATITLVEPKVNTITVETKSMTAKAKKATSKVIAAEAISGDVVFSKVSGNKKISVSESGKISVKKGLTAGKTYTLKVKASVPAHGMYAAAKKTITIKVKVK